MTVSLDDPREPAARSGHAMAQVGPRLTVVLLSGGKSGALAQALDATIPTCRDLGVTVLAVVEDESLVRDFQVRFPEVAFVLVGSGVPTGDRRVTAFPVATGDLVIFADDQSATQSAWGLALARWAGKVRGLPAEPTAAWSTVLTARGVPGALDGL